MAKFSASKIHDKIWNYNKSTKKENVKAKYKKRAKILHTNSKVNIDLANLNNLSENKYQTSEMSVIPTTSNDMKNFKTSATNTGKIKKKIKKYSQNWKNLKNITRKMLQSKLPTNKATREQDVHHSRATKAIAIDCEMVGAGWKGKINLVARVSLVDENEVLVYDKFVKPMKKVTDYRTRISGVRPSDLLYGAEDFGVVKKEVMNLIKGRILVGHAISNDINCLLLPHPKHMIRDTQKFERYANMVDSKRPGLKTLALRVLGLHIQKGPHSSVEDARTTMKLYNLHKKEWEESL